MLGIDASPGLSLASSMSPRPSSSYALLDNPFITQLQSFLPRQIKPLMRFNRWAFYSHDIYGNIVRKMAEYPITDVMVSPPAGSRDTAEFSDKNISAWKDFLDNEVEIRKVMLGMGLDYFVYGNSFVLPVAARLHYYRCQGCSHTFSSDDPRLQLRRFDKEKKAFRHKCFKCGDSWLTAEKPDKPVVEFVRPLRLNPENFEIDYNPMNGESTYFFKIPGKVKAKLMDGEEGADYRKWLPPKFVAAALSDGTLRFKRDTLFHFAAPGLAEEDMGWGKPPSLNVMQAIYMMAMVRKAEEQICVSPETLVETVSGLRRADDIREGDLLRTHLGRYMPVVKRFDRAAKDGELARKITISSLRCLPGEYSPEHPMLMITRNEIHRRSDSLDSLHGAKVMKNPHLFAETFVPAGAVKKGSYLLYPTSLPGNISAVDLSVVAGLPSSDKWIYQDPRLGAGTIFALETAASRRPDGVSVNEWKCAQRLTRNGKTPSRFPKILPLTEDLAYVLGWYAGDGACGSRHTDFFMNPKDDAIKLRDKISAVFGVSGSITKSKTAKMNILSVSNTMFRAVMQGLVPGTAREKRVPGAIMNAPRTVKLAFMKGLFEADGCLVNRNGDVDLATSSVGMMYDVYRLLLDAGCIPSVQYVRGGKASVIKKTGRAITSGDSYHVSARGESGRRLRVLFSGADAAPIRKSGKSGFFWKNYFAVRVSSVEEVLVERYVNYEVAEDNTYCTPGVATHNCSEHIVPMRVLSPGMSGGMNPMEWGDMASWQAQLQQWLYLWKLDKNIMPITNFPVNVTNVGGDSRALLSTPQLQEFYKLQIINGMGVPREFHEGGLSFSSSSMSVRMMQNGFDGMRISQNRFLDFFKKFSRRAKGFPDAALSFSPLRLADDVQKTQMMLQLMDKNLVSREDALSYVGFDYKEQRAKILAELKGDQEMQAMGAKAQAESAKETTIINARAQAEAEYEHMRAQQELQDKEKKRQLMEQQAARRNEMMGMNEQELQQFVMSGGASVSDILYLANHNKVPRPFVHQLIDMVVQMQRQVLEQFGINPVTMEGLPQDLATQIGNNIMPPKDIAGIIQQMQAQAAAEAAAAQGQQPGQPAQQGGQPAQQGGGQQPQGNPNVKKYASELAAAKSPQERSVLMSKIKASDPEGFAALQAQQGGK